MTVGAIMIKGQAEAALKPEFSQSNKATLHLAFEAIFTSSSYSPLSSQFQLQLKE